MTIRFDFFPLIYLSFFSFFLSGFFWPTFFFFPITKGAQTPPAVWRSSALLECIFFVKKRV